MIDPGCRLAGLHRVGRQIADDADDFIPSTQHGARRRAHHASGTVPFEIAKPAAERILAAENLAHERQVHNRRRRRTGDIRGLERPSGHHANTEHVEEVGRHATEPGRMAGRRRVRPPVLDLDSDRRLLTGEVRRGRDARDLGEGLEPPYQFIEPRNVAGSVFALVRSGVEDCAGVPGP